tara:strand:- start:259 stop:441 length:183 start_codon:yes stop_codon:yes gene_type:complete
LDGGSDRGHISSPSKKDRGREHDHDDRTPEMVPRIPSMLVLLLSQVLQRVEVGETGVFSF